MEACTSPSLGCELAVRVSGLAVHYPAVGALAGRRVPDLGLCQASAATIFGLLDPARFV